MSETDIGKCPFCNGEINWKEAKKGENAYFCEKCNQWILTKEAEPIDYDETIYTIILNQVDYEDEEHYKAISEVGKVSLDEAKNLLKQECAVLLKGKALEILDNAFILDKCEISYKIEPEFPYQKRRTTPFTEEEEEGFRRLIEENNP